MPNELVFDAETGSQVRLGNVGSNIACYMKHSSTFMWCLAYSINGAPPLLWYPNNGPIPDVFRTADRIIAHNIEFERALWRHVLIPRYGFPPLPPAEHWFCTLAAARMCALPGKLKDVACILGLPQQKLDVKVMLRMMKPRKPRQGEDPAGIYWNDDPNDFRDLCEYCQGDVACELALYQWIQRHWGTNKSSTEPSFVPMRSSESL
jgi:DNA polymerase